MRRLADDYLFFVFEYRVVGNRADDHYYHGEDEKFHPRDFSNPFCDVLKKMFEHGHDAV